MQHPAGEATLSLTLSKRDSRRELGKLQKKVSEATSKLALLKAEPIKRWHLLHLAKTRLAEEKEDLALVEKKWATRLKGDEK